MNVKLINKEERKTFLKDWGEFSAICYNTPIKHANGIGKHCLSSGHFSGCRHLPFIFKIEDISRCCANQLIRHTTGMTINQRSQRYVNENNFKYVIPPEIGKDKELLKKYINGMEFSSNLYEELQIGLISNGRTEEQANEDARYMLPNACNTKLNITFTLEALINLANKRLCTRSQWEIRQLVKLMINEVVSILPELKYLLVSQCDALGYCPENNKKCEKYKKK